MTREEARNELVLWRNRNSDNGYYHEFVEALTIAIKALEQQPSEDCISREDVMKCFKKWQSRMATRLWDYEQELNALPTVTPSYNSVKPELKPCDDCISREEVNELVDELARAISDERGCMSIRTPRSTGVIMGDILHLPSVNPQRKRGKWIEIEICNCHATLRCSVCDRVIEPTFTFGEYSYESIKKWYPFCHCGADMRGDTDE